MSLVWVPFDPQVLGELPESLTVEQVDVDQDIPDSVSDVEFFVPHYDTLIDVSEVLGQMKNLRVVQTQTAGVDNIVDLVPDTVTLCNARGVHDASTAELAMGLMIALLRGIPDFVRAQEAGQWVPSRRRALADHQVLIVGYGSIGAALERRLVPFEADVVRVARSARDGVHAMSDLPGLLALADVVVLLVPYSEATHHLVDTGFLARMKDQAVLINVSRGRVVDTEALLAEVRTGRLLAGLDVTDPEPLPPAHPLWREPGVLISPHVGGATTAMAPRAYALIRDQVLRFAAGEPLANVVPPNG